MVRGIVCALLLALTAACQDGQVPPDSRPKTQPIHKSFIRSRRGLAILGGAIAGAGVALLATSASSRQVPAANCSFYPAPFAPCIPAHTENTRSRAQDGAGAGLLVGGIVVVYASMR